MRKMRRLLILFNSLRELWKRRHIDNLWKILEKKLLSYLDMKKLVYYSLIKNVILIYFIYV
jgi:hypothetical protein